MDPSGAPDCKVQRLFACRNVIEINQRLRLYIEFDELNRWQSVHVLRSRQEEHVRDGSRLVLQFFRYRLNRASILVTGS